MVLSHPTITTVGDFPVNIASFTRHLRAENASPSTIAIYTGAATRFADFLAEKGMPLEVANVRREHVETFITHLLETRKPATANNRYRSLQAFFKWLREEGEIEESPMVHMRPPKIPELAPPILR
ncbi:MAG TPA: phage integrase N-terminal SAM-like domain-containing protein [Tepidiformaceae bacterium]